MHYTSSNAWRPGRQTMLNINPWEPVPYEQANAGPADKRSHMEYCKHLPEKTTPDTHNSRQH